MKNRWHIISLQPFWSI